MDLADKLSQNLVETDSGCWEFVGARNNKGYGNVNIGNNVYKKAHRLSYEIMKGPIPKGMLVCHSCDNPSCCNPKHLFLGTDKDNKQDSISKNRHAVFKGSAHGNHKLKEDEVIEIRRLHVMGYKYPEIASIYDVSPSCIAFIIQKKTWRHIL